MSRDSWRLIRLVAYLVYAVAGPLLIWTQTRGWTGDAEYQLWIGVGSVLGFTAASNVFPRGEGGDDVVE